jgi:hypothetical protein
MRPNALDIYNCSSRERERTRTPVSGSWPRAA